MRWFRSTDDGRTWEATEVGARSLLAHRAQSMKPGDTYDDGSGNLYRFEFEGQG